MTLLSEGNVPRWVNKSIVQTNRGFIAYDTEGEIVAITPTFHDAAVVLLGEVNEELPAIWS